MPATSGRWPTREPSPASSRAPRLSTHSWAGERTGASVQSTAPEGNLPMSVCQHAIFNGFDVRRIWKCFEIAWDQLRQVGGNHPVVPLVIFQGEYQRAIAKRDGVFHVKAFPCRGPRTHQREREENHRCNCRAANQLLTRAPCHGSTNRSSVPTTLLRYAPAALRKWRSRADGHQ